MGHRKNAQQSNILVKCKPMIGRTIGQQLILFFCIYSLIYLSVDLQGINTEGVSTLLSITTFTFAIVIGFLIAGRHERMTTIRSHLRENDAFLQYLYVSSGKFGKKKQKECQKLIDAYVICQLDYDLNDYHKSNPLLIDLLDFVLSLRLRTKREEVVADHL